MSEYQNFPKYESKYNTSLLGTESQVLEELNNYQNPTLLSTEMKYDKSKMIVKPAIYSEPKYIKEKKTYEVLKPITKDVMQIPDKRKHKVKTTKTIYNKEIVIGENEDLNLFLLDNAKFEQEVNVPLPTKSTIQNLCKDSVIQSFHPSFQQSNSIQSKYSKTENNYNYLDNQNAYGTKIETNIVMQEIEKPQNSQNQSNFSYNSKHLSKNPNPNPIKVADQYSTDMNKKYPSTNMKYDYQMSKISKFPSTYTNAEKVNYGAKITNIPNKSGYNNINKSNQYNLTEPNISKHSNQSKIHISNEQDNMDGGFVEATDVSKKSSNKNYIETYFHDDDIPKPMVLEGDALKGSDIKENTKKPNNIIQPSTNEINSSKHSVQVAKLENSSVSKKSNNLSMKQSSSIHTNKSNMNNSKNMNDMNNTNNNNISQKSSQHNYNDPNKSVKIKKLYSKDEQQSNNPLGELPVDRTEIMSQQPSVNMSQKNSKMLNQSGDQQVIQDSRIQKQSQIYQQQSKNNSSINQKSSNHQSIKQSNAIEKSKHQSMQQSNVNGNISNHNSKIQNEYNKNSQIQRSNMTYQQPYNPYNYSSQLETPQAYHSQNYNNEYNNNQKTIKESSHIKNSHHSNYMQSNLNEEQSFGNKNSQLQNQSSIYQQSMKKSGTNNINTNSNISNNHINSVNANNINNNINNSNFNSNFNNMNNYNNINSMNNNINNSDFNNNNFAESGVKQSTHSKIERSINSVNQSRGGESNSLIYSSKNKKSDKNDFTPYGSNISKNNNNFNNNNSIKKDERPSFPTKSFAGNITSKDTLPPNPFGDEMN